MKLYLAGPMRGRPEQNFPAFREGAERLRRLGHTVWSPAEYDLQHGYDPVSDPEPALVNCMKHDLAALLECDGVALLPGWKHSTGAQLEAHVALVCGLVLLDAETGERLWAETTTRPVHMTPF